MLMHWSRLLQRVFHELGLLRRGYDIRVCRSRLFQDLPCNDYAQSENREKEGWWEFGRDVWSVSCFEFFVQLLWNDRVWSDELTTMRNLSEDGTIKRDKEKEVIESIALGRERWLTKFSSWYHSETQQESSLSRTDSEYDLILWNQPTRRDLCTILFASASVTVG